MNNLLSADFTVNKEKKTITINRAFAAELSLVWDAWTKPEILDLWWAPKPYRTQTKSMDFRVGGFWLYAMFSPENVAHWCRTDYKTIDKQKSYSLLDAFCDENGVINKDFPQAHWTNSFKEAGNDTLVNIVIQYNELADLEKIIELGFKEGFNMAIGNLIQYLEEQMKLRNK